ncbi:sulfatase family protein [Rosistilla oblonga]|uniref:sulfatase family protein n=1 Tax=Rosistilla oblonga TaxID=2527990 RepID=UPI003A96E865
MRCLVVSVVLFISCLGVGGDATEGKAQAAEPSRPNIVYILADDMGIGDVQAFNPEGKIATPAMNRLAAEGMRFNDAHSGSAVCSPTRYGILTGRYSWRTRLQSGVTWGYSLPLIDSQRMTVASMLKSQGYNTACIGKWHLGLEWGLKDPSKKPSDDPKEPWDNIDFAKPITSGPLQLGFDTFFGISASLDMHPYVYIEDDHLTGIPTKEVAASGGKKFWRKGPVGDDFQHIGVLDRLTDRAVDYIETQTADKPFFLYFPLPAPHTPIVPTEAFQNKSGLNEWGDFVMQVDSVVGSVMQAIEKQGLTDNTLIIVTSDNGATPKADFAELKAKGHNPSSVYRGNKADAFEGGHRVAFIARWPAVIAAGTASDATICHTDLLATAAEATGAELPADAAVDSVSMLPLMKDADTPTVREATVHHSVNGSFAIRKGSWKLMFCPGSGGWSTPRPPAARKQKLPPLQLFDLATDIGETKNVADSHPEVVQELSQLMAQYIERGRSTPGADQENEVEIRLMK